MSVVADIIPDWGTSAGFELKGMPGDVAEALQSCAEDLALAPTVNMAWKWARKDGGGAVVKVLNDGRPSSAPIDYANLTSVAGLVALDRTELQIIKWGNTGTGIGPLLYQDQHGQEWHHQRVVPIYNRELALRRRPFYQYWSVGEFDRVYADFLRDRSVQEALAKLLKEYSYDVLFIDGLRAASKDKVKEALIGIGLGIQKIGKFALDAKDDYRSQTKTMAGLPDSVKLITARLAMITRIPASILLFENPGGLNSGANTGDWEALFGQVAADQPKHYSPVIVNVLTDVLRSLTGPTGGRPVTERWRVEPKPLGRLSPERAATVRSTNASARTSDISSGLVTVEEARRDPDVVALYSLNVSAPSPTEELQPELAPDLAAAPITAPDAVALPDGSGAIQPGAMQDVALNGAQVSSMLEIVAAPISRRQMRAVLRVSYPSASAADIEDMLPLTDPAPTPAATPATDAELPEQEPAPTPGQPPAGENLMDVATVKARYGVGLGALKSMVRRKLIRGWKYPSGWRFLESEVAVAGLHNPDPGPEPEGETTT